MDSAGTCCVVLERASPIVVIALVRSSLDGAAVPEAHLPFEPLDLVADRRRIALEAIGTAQLIAWSALGGRRRDRPPDLLFGGPGQCLTFGGSG